MKNWISITISIAALVLAIVAIARVAPVQGLYFDYLGAIIGVLSFLVTLLIGYQIYTLINVKEELRVVREVKNNVDVKLQEQENALKKDFKEELKQVAALLMAMASREREIIETEIFKTYKECTNKQMAKELSRQMILMILGDFSNATNTKVRDQNLDELVRNIQYEDAVEFYSDFVNMKEKGENKHIEPFLLELIAKLSEKENHGNKE